MSTPGYKGARLRIPKRVHAICHAVTTRLAGFAIALSSLALASGAPTLNVTSDTAQEAETSIVAIEIGGATHVVTAYIRFAPKPRVNFRAGDGRSIWGGALPLPAGYEQSYDPYLAVNPYDDGVMPKTVYLVANAKRYDGSRYHVAVVGWRSLDGGRSWQGPTVIADSVSVDEETTVDKPHIAVSWQPATRGWLYVGYSDAAGRLVARRSEDGGVHFSAPRVITSIHARNKDSIGLQLVVSPYTGHVYALWGDFADDRIYWARSTDHGEHWSERAVFPNRDTPAHFLMDRGGLNGIRRTISLPIARFNWPARRISVVWHECNVARSTKQFCRGQERGESLHTDIYYATLGIDGGSDKVRVNDDGGDADQFLPALDFDSAGNVLVTFLDRRDDPDNLAYRLYRAWIDADGSALAPNRAVAPFSSTPARGAPLPGFLGDYHETWMTPVNGVATWFSAWIGEGGDGPDVFVSAIRP